MRKRIAILTLSLASAFFLVGFLTDIVIAERDVYSTHSYSDYCFLPPLSKRSVEQNISKEGSILSVYVHANATWLIDVLYNDQPFFSSSEAKEGTRNYFLQHDGIWVVRISNKNPTDYSQGTYIISIKELQQENTKPYTWLRLPLLALGSISASTTIPLFYFDKFKNRLNKRTVGTVIVIIFFLMVLFSYQIGEFILNTSAPWVIANGVSMEPTIHNGDLVIIKGVEPGNLAERDIILYQKITPKLTQETISQTPTPILHRIIVTFNIGEHWYYKTQGDNSNPDDWYVPNEGVLGKAVLIIPQLGYLILLLERIEVKLLLVAFIALIFFVFPAIKSMKKQNKQSQENEIKNSKRASTYSKIVAHMFYISSNISKIRRPAK